MILSNRCQSNSLIFNHCLAYLDGFKQLSVCSNDNPALAFDLISLTGEQFRALLPSASVCFLLINWCQDLCGNNQFNIF